MSGAERYSAVKRVDLLDCFALRCWARAYLWHAGELELAEAVDVLQEAAEAYDLTERLTVDEIHSVIAHAFEQYRDDDNAEGGAQC